ncbi:MAG: hypothetical protein GX369_07775 [Euryarchaeota archaeon]|nr:hypothetical protein [Euryarchaeota archaeon]
MDREATFRRIVHLSAPLSLIYYYLPSPIWSGGPTREFGLLFLLLIVLIVESLRLLIGFHVPGLRNYEKKRISAGAWAAIAMTFTMLFFPLSIAAPAITGMAIIDPLISAIRNTRWYPWIPMISYFLLAISLLSLFYPLSSRIIFAAAIGSFLAIGSEALRCRRVDDDFLMIVIPLLGMAAVICI